MSFWVCAYCNASVATVTPDNLASGIAKRLRLLTYLFCPDEEEEPGKVLTRLRIDDLSAGGEFGTLAVHYRADPTECIQVHRTPGRAMIDGLEDEVLAGRPEPELARVRQLLGAATESVSFSLKDHDVRGMGFPLAIAAAAHLVQTAGGVIRSGSYSFMVPKGDEVDIIASFER